jgi:hypothetical protein
MLVMRSKDENALCWREPERAGGEPPGQQKKQEITMTRKRVIEISNALDANQRALLLRICTRGDLLRALDRLGIAEDEQRMFCRVCDSY